MMNPIDRRNGMNSIKLTVIFFFLHTLSACDRVGGVVITPVATTTPIVGATDATPHPADQTDAIPPTVISTVPPTVGTTDPTPHPVDQTDATPPTIISISPNNGATDVALDTAISATFSESMATSSLTALSFTVSANGNNIAGTVSYIGTTVTFTPAAILPEAVTFTVAITTGAMDAANNPLSADFFWTFTTAPPKAWEVAEPIETNDGRASNPKVASDGNGNAIAVWYQDDGTGYRIFANYYISDTGWGKAVLIGRDNLGNAYYPQVAMDSSGNAIAVWHQHDGATNSIWANRYLSGQGWGIAETIETGQLKAIDPQIAMNSSGYAIVVWSYQHDGTTNNIWANRYQPDRGWDGARLIGKNAGYASYPQVDVDGHGDAIAVWSQTDGTNDNIWANRYRFAKGWDKGWGEATLIETDHGDAYDPQVAMDGNGNAIAVWYQGDGLNDNILANHYISATGWGGATLIETNGLGDASGPQVVMDDSGNAIVVWSQTDGIKKSIWANRYRSGMGAGWDIAGLLEVNDLGDASHPQVGMDSYGNAIVVWSQTDGINKNIWVNRYLFGMDWGRLELFDINSSEDAYDPDVAVDRDGSAIAVWRQYDPGKDTDNIYANSFR